MTLYPVVKVFMATPHCFREENGRKRVKYLQKQLGDIKKEKEKEIQDRNEMIAHLKDQLQEMKAKTNMEGKYSKKCTEVRVAQTQKKCSIEEKNMKDEIEVGVCRTPGQMGYIG